MIGMPLINTHIEDFMQDIDQVKEFVEWKNITSHGKTFKTEQVPLKEFIRILTLNPRWEIYVTDKTSIFLKLLMLDDLFVIKEEVELDLNQTNQMSTMANAENWSIDLINLKVFALLMCPGMPKDKAEIMFNLIYGPPKPIKKGKQPVAPGKEDITWLNPRLI